MPATGIPSPSGPGPHLGRGRPGSPLLAGDDPTDRLTIVMIPVARWSDGTLDVHAAH
ncbi:MAG: hypothetical protein ACTHJX_00235 [Terriglobales bacterium]